MGTGAGAGASKGAGMGVCACTYIWPLRMDLYSTREYGESGTHAWMVRSMDRCREVTVQVGCMLGQKWGHGRFKGQLASGMLRDKHTMGTGAGAAEMRPARAGAGAGAGMGVREGAGAIKGADMGAGAGTAYGTRGLVRPWQLISP